MQHTTFIRTVWEYYSAHKRTMPWRSPILKLQMDGSLDPYPILVSEIMLQQTQVTRVEPKFLNFMKQFPTIKKLAASPLSEVLKTWSGLGYNRRAKFLWQAAQFISSNNRGKV